MPQVVSATKAREDFADIISRVFYRGEEFIVEKQGQPAALITGVGKKNKKQAKKMTGVEFLLKLSKFGFKGGPPDLAKNHDKYAWE